jgi:S-adenosylmethionine decarboxylase
MFGPHLTIDIYGCDEGALSSPECIREMLNEMPEMLGMHKISEPSILPYSGKEGSFDKGGVSAFVIIAESHISIHTFVYQKYASVDIFSCKEFDVEKAVKYVTGKFKAKKAERNFIMRGREFPKEVSKAKVIVRNQRHSLY